MKIKFWQTIKLYGQFSQMFVLNTFNTAAEGLQKNPSYLIIKKKGPRIDVFS